ncbi:hypothetical protein GCM10022224_041860 [Nonomuraea antimicrobica]|uniref:Uncharacterized protein n=1 Tax=Nonomuraea antimicrobica TaxID=561173 RepID=A0ABP7BY08_9ACTN
MCSTPNTALVHSLGSAHVIDHTKEHYTRGTNRYDLLLDHREPRRAREQARSAGGMVECAPFLDRWVSSVRRVVLLSTSTVPFSMPGWVDRAD